MKATDKTSETEKEANLELLRAKFKKACARSVEFFSDTRIVLKKPSIEPIYDSIYFEGITKINSLD